MIDTTDEETDKVIQAWLEAAADLGLEIESPFYLETKEKGIIKYGLLVKYFGSSQGTLLISIDDLAKFDIPEKYGFHCSVLNPYHYSKYERKNFIETLQDWKYFGPLNKNPDWYFHSDSK